MTLECHKKFEEKLTCAFKSDMTQAVGNVKNVNFNGLLLTKVYNV